MPKQSVKTLARTARAADVAARKGLAKATSDGSGVFGVTGDSFVNFTHKLGLGGDNVLSTGTYGFNPITRNKNLLEWIHRGSWLGGVAVDLVANDMTRVGIEFLSELPPDDSEKLDRSATTLATWTHLNETIKWGRLYGGAIAVMLVDGQDLSTPLRIDTVGKGQYKGLLVLDRWMVDPTLEDLVTEFGPHLGLPKYYRIQTNSPALRGKSVHYTRVALRHVGIKLPYQQRLTENLWGESVLERLYDRMVSFDSASMGLAQLVHKSFLRTLSVKGLREIVSSGGPAMVGLVAYVDMMRRFQGVEGMTMVDLDDKFEVQANASVTAGYSDAINQLGQQLSGALQIPLVRLFGQSPAGLNSSGESDLRTYYDYIKQMQEQDLHGGVTAVYRLHAASEGIALPDNFHIGFRSLWQMNDTDKSTVAKSTTEAVTTAMDAALISQQVGMRELRQSSRTTGIFSNITQEDIEAADDTTELPPSPEELMQQQAELQGGEATNEAGSEGAQGAMAKSPEGGSGLQKPAPPSGKAGGRDRKRLNGSAFH